MQELANGSTMGAVRQTAIITHLEKEGAQISLKKRPVEDEENGEEG